MLDPVVSAQIKKFGLFKWACLEYPHMVFSFGVAIVGLGIGGYCAYVDVKKREKMKYFYKYVVMRPDDPRLKNCIVFNDDGEPINP